jgi:hypothetical protein
MENVVNTTNLSTTFDLLNKAIGKKDFTDDRDILEVSRLVLKTLMLAYEAKVFLLRSRKDDSPETYLKATVNLALKGLAQDERKYYRKLTINSEMRHYEDTVEYVETILEACKRYESVLRLVADSMKIGVKLAFEGHN